MASGSFLKCPGDVVLKFGNEKENKTLSRIKGLKCVWK